MTEILFYHLQRQPLERVLPVLLDKTLERGWRAVVQAASEERVEALSSALWTWREEAFLPHGTRQDGHAALQPVWLTDTVETPNDATVRFLVDGATIDDYTGLERIVVMFDGNDADAVQQAREQWKAVAESGLDATYWQQDDNGKWQKKA